MLILGGGGGGGSLCGFGPYGQTLGMLILEERFCVETGEGPGTDMKEFWDRHWRSLYCKGLGGLCQRLGMLTFGGGGGGSV